MDELYGDLENYQEENFIEELKNENKELKGKLEDYASTLSNLQKEFDKLSLEYKKLELNYSSLLKTARAEIERKTQIITNLNLEKDKLVINSMQNRGKILRSNFNNNKNKGNTQHAVLQLAKEADSARGNKCDARVPNSLEKNISTTVNKNERKEKHDKRTSTLDPPLKISSDVKEKEQKLKSFDQNRDGDKNRTDSKKSKENHYIAVSKNESSKVEAKVCKIRDRRKSMPLLNRGDFKYSSDVEQEDNPKDHRFRRKTPPTRDVFDRLHHDKDRSSRNGLDRKLPDMTRVENKRGNNSESYRDNYHKSHSRYPDSDKHRTTDNREKYESSQRSRRHNSPDRIRYNTHREPNDRPHRSDYIKHRVLVSPLPETCNQRQSSRDFDRRRLQNEESYSVKHKLHDGSEEPLCKRMRTNSLTKQPDYQTNIQPNFGSHAGLCRSDEFSYLSLQSPDYLENNHQVHQIKEIMGTAASKLDDPRFMSKKYIVNSNRAKVELSTVVGRDVQLKCVDTTNWDIIKEIQKMPTPLREKPQTEEDLVNEIYMDIDNPMSNFSLESGEIGSEDEMGTLNKNIQRPNSGTANTDSYTKSKTSVHNYIQSEDRILVDKKHTNESADDIQGTCSTIFSKNDKIPKVREIYMDIHPISNCSLESGEIGTEDEIVKINKNIEMYNLDNVDNNIDTELKKSGHNDIPMQDKTQVHQRHTSEIADIKETCSKIFSKNYKIPKIKKSRSPQESDNIEIQSAHKIKKKLTKQSQKKKTDKGKRDSEKNTKHQLEGFNPLNHISNAIEVSKDKAKHKIKMQRKKRSPENVTISLRDTVAGDLELSDETSDFTDICDQTRFSLENSAQVVESNKKHDIDIPSRESNTAEQENFKCISSQIIFKHGTESEDAPCVNKHLLAPRACDLVQPKEPIANTSREFKSKLCDLFGDSGSLITPDDLGILEQPTIKDNLNDYAPLFDNTQDAVDLNVVEMEKVQNRSLKVMYGFIETKNGQENVKSEKKHKSKNKRNNDDCKQKHKNNIEDTEGVGSVLENANAEIEEPNVVKTVIISTGIQNNCQSESVAPNQGQGEPLSLIHHKVNNTEPSCQSITSLKALATSTPQKVILTEQSLTVPEIRCNSNNSIATKDASNVSSNTEDVCQSSQRNVDVPDVRIIVKRRRKARGTSC